MTLEKYPKLIRVRKASQHGVGISIPKELGFKENDMLILDYNKNKLVLRKCGVCDFTEDKDRKVESIFVVPIDKEPHEPGLGGIEIPASELLSPTSKFLSKNKKQEEKQ